MKKRLGLKLCKVSVTLILKLELQNVVPAVQPFNVLIILKHFPNINIILKSVLFCIKIKELNLWLKDPKGATPVN